MTESERHRVELAHLQLAVDLLVNTLQAVQHAVPQDSEFREPIDDAFHKLKVMRILK